MNRDRSGQTYSDSIVEYNRPVYYNDWLNRHHYHLNTANPRGRYRSNINYGTYAGLRRWASQMRQWRTTPLRRNRALYLRNRF